MGGSSLLPEKPNPKHRKDQIRRILMSVNLRMVGMLHLELCSLVRLSDGAQRHLQPGIPAVFFVFHWHKHSFTVIRPRRPQFLPRGFDWFSIHVVRVQTDSDQVTLA